jgi:hypothetical protein
MSWKKYFTPVTAGSESGMHSPFSGMANSPGPARTNYSSYLPDVYVGAPNRVDRYSQYETMDQDSEVNAALDILAEFCTQKDDDTDLPFRLKFRRQGTNSEVSLIHQYLLQWCKLQNFDRRIFRILRNVFKYGDAFFIKDPETKKWFYVDPSKVTKIIVNESEGKNPEQYFIKDINLNFESLVATKLNITNTTGAGAGYTSGGMVGSNPDPSATTSSRFQQGDNEYAIDAENVIHLSMSEGLDNNYPFGNSLLETIFKVYKQKELLEDAIIIYRVQRAPERRVFYVDVGNMPSHLAMQFVERVKTEIHQRRIPSATGGGKNVIDSSYNPLSINEDYFFPQTAEGRGSKVETLPGGTNLGEIDDLKYFTNKLVRGLRIPSSYLPTAADDGQSQFNDGRVGTAYIQELRFNTYCERLQSLVGHVFDSEFKQYLHEQGINLDLAMFEVKFEPPQNFAAYRQSELDNARVPTYSQMSAIPYISNRFAMKRFLGMTDQEIAENERLWREENEEDLTVQQDDADASMRGVGVTGSGLDADIAAGTEEVPTGDSEEGGEQAPPDTTTGDTLGGGGGETAATDQTI